MASTYELIIKAVDQTSAPLGKVEKGLKQVNTRAVKVNATVKKMNSSFKTIGKAGMKGLGSLTRGLRNVSVAAVAGAGAFAFMAKSTMNTLDTLGKTATKLGVTTEFLSKYQVIANRAGISTETFNMGLQRFLRRLGEAQTGSGELLKPLKAMGISMKDSNGNFREGTEVFAEFMRKLGGVKNSTLALSLAMKGFDSEGVAMINIANMGADKIELIGKRAAEAGLIISKDLTKAAADANDAMAELFDVGKGFRMQFFGALSETIKDLTKMLREKLILTIEGQGGMKAFANSLAAGFLEGTSKFIKAMAKFVDDFKNAFAKFGNVMKHIIVAISKVTPGLNVEMGFSSKDEKVKSLKADLAEMNAEYEKMAKVFAEQGGQVDFGFGAAMDGMVLGMQALREKIIETQNDSTIYFQEMKIGSKSTQEGVKGITKELDDQAAALRIIAAEEKAVHDFNKQYPVYEDAILRAAKAAEKLGANTDVAVSDDKKDKILTFADHYKQMSDAVEKNIKIMQFNSQILNDIEQKYASGSMEASRYIEFKKQLGVTTKELAKNFSQLLEELKLNSSKTIETTAQNMKLYQALVQAGAGADVLKEAFSSLNIAVESLPFDQQIAHYQSLIANNDATAASTLKLRDALLAEGATREQLTEAGFSFAEAKEKEKTFNETLIEQYKEQAKELKNVETALANVSVLAKQAGVDEKFLTDTLEEQRDTIQESLGIYQEKALTTADIIQEGFKGMSSSISKELATAIRTGESMMDALSNVFSRTLDNILQQILESQINSALGQLFNVSGGGGGGGFNLGNLITGFLGTPTVGAPMGGLTLPGRANGGPTKGGSPYIVGERGPELFVPNTTGKVVSNEELNSGSDAPIINFNINAMDTQTGVEFLIKNKPQIINMVTQGYNQRGRAGITG